LVPLSSLLSQANRERALSAFRKGEFRILVATDVAARGLDISDIDLVVNYDVPSHAEEYVHRIGRTGRAHRSGRAVTLVTELDARRVDAIEGMLGGAVRREHLEGFAYDTRPRPGRGGSRSSGDSARPDRRPRSGRPRRGKVRA
jgi:superfamily II DNA/RNA helicase